ncbi:hypothetical protein DFH06DRAFT_1345937 [Mycena polygramma]|nr:hypothetical protein DFH06DRAFT_1345937 [Mycena polygramma]
MGGIPDHDPRIAQLSPPSEVPGYASTHLRPPLPGSPCHPFSLAHGTQTAAAPHRPHTARRLLPTAIPPSTYAHAPGPVPFPHAHTPPPEAQHISRPSQARASSPIAQGLQRPLHGAPPPPRTPPGAQHIFPSSQARASSPIAHAHPPHHVLLSAAPAPLEAYGHRCPSESKRQLMFPSSQARGSRWPSPHTQARISPSCTLTPAPRPPHRARLPHCKHAGHDGRHRTRSSQSCTLIPIATDPPSPQPRTHMLPRPRARSGMMHPRAVPSSAPATTSTPRLLISPPR